jgi:hypothetical protein
VEILFLLYIAIGGVLGGWIGFIGPVRPDNMGRAGALLCIVLLWPCFLVGMRRF